jgi:hypothetical protein
VSSAGDLVEQVVRPPVRGRWIVRGACEQDRRGAVDSGSVRPVGQRCGPADAAGEPDPRLAGALGVRGERASELSRGYEVMEAATGPSRRRARQESPDSLSPCSSSPRSCFCAIISPATAPRQRSATSTWERTPARSRSSASISPVHRHCRIAAYAEVATVAGTRPQEGATHPRGATSSSRMPRRSRWGC